MGSSTCKRNTSRRARLVSFSIKPRDSISISSTSYLEHTNVCLQCDEALPACRNCQKSKRECAGYDPIFKQQQGPAAIQPAPSSAPSQGGSTATSQGYGNQPHMLGYGGVSNMNYDPTLSGSVSSPGSAGQQYDYASAIDPALESAAPPTASGVRYTPHPGM
jgi:hypothetical protein